MVRKIGALNTKAAVLQRAMSDRSARFDSPTGLSTPTVAFEADVLGTKEGNGEFSWGSRMLHVLPCIL